MSSVGAEPARPVGRSAEALLDGLTRRAIAGRIPISGSIAMSHRCNLRCHHCYLGEERFVPPNGGELPTEFWLSALDQVVESGCLKLLITGGDTLLRADFTSVYSHAVRLGLIVTVFTNGTLVDSRVLAAFEELPPRAVEITLYGATQEVYERVTGVPGSHARCLRGVDRLLARGIPVGLKAMVLADNVHEIGQMREMAAARGVRFRIDPNLSARFSGDKTPLLQRVPADQAVALEMQDADLVRRSAEFYERRRGLRSEARLYGCLAAVTSFHVDPRGTLTPCQMPTGFGYDLKQGSFREGWLDLARFHEQLAPAGFECNECSARALCGQCPAQFALENGSPHVKSDYNCSLGAARLAALEALTGLARWPGPGPLACGEGGPQDGTGAREGWDGTERR